MDQTFRELISKVKCGELSPASFSEDDLAKVKSCLPPIEKSTPDSPPTEPTFTESCLPAALKEAQQIVEAEQANVKKATEVAKVRARLIEYRDNLKIIEVYYAERLNFFLSVSSASDPINAEKMSVVDKLAAEYRKLSPNQLTIINLIAARQQLAVSAREAVSQKISQLTVISDSTTGRELFANSLRDQVKQISGKIKPVYRDKSLVFDISFFELVNGEILDGETKYNILIKNSQYLAKTSIL